jgi:hypothetical protein
MTNNFLPGFNTTTSAANQPTSNPAPSGSIFSGIGTAPATGSGLFGTSAAASQAPQNPPSSLFNPPNPEEKKAQPGGAALGGGLFGTSTGTTSAQSAPFFGTNLPPAKTEVPKPQTTLTFSTSATTQSTSSGSLFAQPNTGEPRPQSNLPGQTASAPSLFSQPPAAQPTSSAQGGLLGQVQSIKPQTTSASSTHAGSSQGLFPGPPTSAATGGSIARPATTGASTGLFSSTQPGTGGLFPGASKPEEKKVEEKKNEYVPLQSLEEIKTAALTTKSLDDILNKWRGTLISLSSDFKQTAYEVKQREICLYQTIEQIRSVLQMNDNINKEFEQQKQQLETISKEQVSV